MQIEQTTFFTGLIMAAAALIASVVWLMLAMQRIRFQNNEIERIRSELEVSLASSIEQRTSYDELLLEKEKVLSKLDAQLSQKDLLLDEAKKHLTQLNTIKDHHIELQARCDEKEAQLLSKERMMEETKKVLFKEFEISANKLFESKQQSFSQMSKQNLELVLSPFKQQLTDFNKQVGEVYHKENVQRNQLIGQISELQKQAKQISDDANNLASALKGDNKVQGQWGEIILERLLEQSGLVKGREYDTQLSFKNDEGKSFRPDVVIHLPEEKDIVVDSKVALVEYERYSSEDNTEKKGQFLKSHVEALRTHIKGLSLKKYQQLEGLRTLDFVFMFVPIEAAYVAAVQSAPSLFKEAYDKNIMLVSPSSLMVALRTVETMWRYEKQNANAEKIANSAGKLYDQFVLVMTAIEEVGNYIHKAGESYDTVLNRVSRGRGNILKRIEDLKKLGAKSSKRLPKKTQDLLELEESCVELVIEDKLDS